MDPAALMPTPDVIPVHWSLFQGLLLVTFTLHLLLMNGMVGLAVIACARHFSLKGNSSPPTEAASKTIPYFIAFAVNFGVAPLLFLQVLYGHLFYTSSILMAVYWLSIVGLLILAYALSYTYKYSYYKLIDGRTLLTAAIALLLLLIGFFFVNNSTMMMQPVTWSRYFNQPGGLLLNLGDLTVWPRYLHFMASAVAVGGLFIALYFNYKKKTGMPDADEWISYGCKWFAYATMVNFAIGTWFLSSIPSEALGLGNTINIVFLVLLFAGIISGFASALFALQERVMPALRFLIITIILMVLVREELRAFYLKPWFHPSQLEVHAEYLPFALFLLVLIAGLLLANWMLKFTMRHLHKHNSEVQS